MCEDALTSKGLNTQLRVIGGGARSATDKVSRCLNYDRALKLTFAVTDLPRQLTWWQVQHYRLLCRELWHLLPVLRQLPQPGQAKRHHPERGRSERPENGHRKYPMTSDI